MLARLSLLSIGVSLATLTSFSTAQGEVFLPTGFALEVVAGPEVVSEPMDLTFAPDGAAWVTGRAGDLWRIDPATHASHRIGRVDSDVSGDRGV